MIEGLLALKYSGDDGAGKPFQFISVQYRNENTYVLHLFWLNSIDNDFRSFLACWVVALAVVAALNVEAGMNDLVCTEIITAMYVYHRDVLRLSSWAY